MADRITPELLKALRTSWASSFNGAFAGAKPRYTEVAMITKTNGRTGAYAWMGQMPALREWIGQRIIHDLNTYGFEIENKDFEMMVRVKRNDILDDLVGTYGPLFSEMGRSAALHPDELVFSLLPKGFTASCYDGQNFFDDNHLSWNAKGEEIAVSNYQDGAGPAWYLLDTSREIRPLIYQRRQDYNMISLDDVEDPNVVFNKEFLYGSDGRSNAGYGMWQMAYASKAPLNSENYDAACIAMASLRGDSGKILAVKPTVLVVPPALKTAGRNVFKPNLAGGESNVLADDKIDLMVIEHLAE